MLFKLADVSQLLETRENRIPERLDPVHKKQDETRNASSTRSKEANLMVDLLFEYTAYRHTAELKFLELVKG